MVRLGSLYRGPGDAPLSHRVRNLPAATAATSAAVVPSSTSSSPSATSTSSSSVAVAGGGNGGKKPNPSLLAQEAEAEAQQRRADIQVSLNQRILIFYCLNNHCIIWISPNLFLNQGILLTLFYLLCLWL